MEPHSIHLDLQPLSHTLRAKPNPEGIPASLLASQITKFPLARSR